ncbi:class I SAM-dependent methyltransferase [Tessaracoccus sp. MC1756]|uniref:class I SAM-dependent methyltransferase n=1 Tax=Tessaracoccus sp. MC1756 TaxID=2760311 RepID=UPI001C71C3C8
MTRTAALEAAMLEADPSSLKAGERLRARFTADEVAWALTQAALRRKGVAKFTRASEMLFTPAGLEQASREPVARWRAQRFLAAGVTEVWDLGCGIGADAMAFAAAGLRVVAVELDRETAAVARHNLDLVGGGEVTVAAAEDVDVPAEAAVFLDPARRTARGRTWNVADFAPSWEFVLAHLAGERFACVKLGPGVPKELIPGDVQACFVSHHGDVVEASLWSGLPEGPQAVVLASAQDELGPAGRRPLDVRPVGRYLIEPDGAVIRAGLLDAIEPERDLWLLDAHIAYLSSDEPVSSPFATDFEVLEDLPYDLKGLRAWVRDNSVGTLEIKKRGLEIDPAALRRQLKPKGPNAATIVLARTVRGTRALICRRALGTVKPCPSRPN